MDEELIKYNYMNSVNRKNNFFEDYDEISL